MSDHCCVMTTAGDAETAAHLASSAVEQHIIAEHSWDKSEVAVIPLAGGSKPYSDRIDGWNEGRRATSATSDWRGSSVRM
ncbi:MAG: hypothetical protein GEU93_07020 [Propionibacteriales bacterium]|nr:hypothetical protein [Propionibacteriales bacterium]